MTNSSSGKVGGAAASASAQLVFVPAPFTGHIISMVEIAKLLVDRDPRLFITIFIINLPFDTNVAAYTHSLPTSVTHPRIRFVSLPPPSEDDGDSLLADKPASSGTSPSFAVTFATIIEKNKQGVRDGASKFRAESSDSSGSGRLAGFVVDMCCLPMMDVANEFGVPTYLYYTSGATVLGLSLHFQALHDETGKDLTEFIDSDTELAVPGFKNPVPAGRVLPSVITNKDESTQFANRARRFRNTKGILVNTFAGLESHAVESFVKSGSGFPRLYPVGPILNLAGDSSLGSGDRTNEIVKWLDEQPPSSVVFLCFGSMGSFDAEQVREITYGLERSGHRFLWSLRRPPSNGRIQPGEYSDPDEVLPEGFLKRTAEVGMVIGWAPQVVVLSHPAVAGFVSHCGWNSVLESLWFGVPVATWPMYAEQQVNAFTLVRELGLAVEISINYKRDRKKGTSNFLVTREEVERGIRCLMDEDSVVREKVKEMRKESRKTAAGGGSSYAYVGRFIEDVISNMTP